MTEHKNQPQKRPYSPPRLETYGAIANFTTGGSGMRSEWSWSWKTTGMGMDKVKEKVWKQSMHMMRNQIKP